VIDRYQHVSLTLTLTCLFTDLHNQINSLSQMSCAVISKCIVSCRVLM